MPKAMLVAKNDGGEGRRYPIDRAIILGRTKDCAVVIDDSAASRHHMEIVPRKDEYFWRDLNSTNGVLINEESMLEGRLKNGDTIRIGGTVLVFKIMPDAIPSAKGRSSLFIQTLLDPEGHAIGEIESKPDEGEDAGTMLEAVHTVMNEIASNYEPCSLVDKILETTMKAIDAQRGAIFFAAPDSEDLHPCPVCGQVHLIRDGVISHTSGDEIHISRSVARRVLGGEESVLIRDTGLQDGIDPSESIMSLSLRSIICVPLRGKYGPLGILYIDSDRPEQQYTRAHMLLSTAVGSSAGLALENAKMHQEILDKQRIEQELEFAGTIQEGFLIKSWPEDDARFEVYGDMRAAKTVGGDFYDFLQLSPDEVGFLVGDVSGKGVPGALAMARILAEFRVRAFQSTSPEEVLNALNNNFVQHSQRGMFCTLCYMTVNLVTGLVKCANAGHNPTVHLSSKGLTEFGHGVEPPIGIIPDIEWSSAEMILKAGESLMMYTDGITEARAATTTYGTATQNELDEFGVDGMMRVIEKHQDDSPLTLAKMIMDATDAYCVPEVPHDDRTVITLRYKG